MAKEDFTAEDDPETQQAIEGAATSEFKRLVDRLKAQEEKLKAECPTST